MARWAGDINRTNEAHRATQKDTAAVTAGRIQNQAAKKLEIAEWKTQAKNRMKNADNEAREAEAKAGVAVFENSKKEEVYAAKKVEQEAKNKIEQGKALHAADLAESEVESQDALTDQRKAAAEENRADARLSDAKAAAEGTGGEGTNLTKAAIKTSNNLYETMVEDGMYSQTMIDNATALNGLYSQGAASGKWQPLFNQIAAHADQLGLTDKLPEWAMPGFDPANLPTQQVIEAFNKQFMGKMILAGGRGISNEDAIILEKGLSNTSNTEETNEYILKYQEHKGNMSNMKTAFFGENIQDNNKSHAYAQKQWNKTYGQGFKSVAITDAGTLDTFTHYKRRYIKLKRDRGFLDTITPEMVVTSWDTLYHPDSEFLNRSKGE